MAIRTKEFYERMNRVMEKLALTHLSPNESKYCMVVLRKTFGYGKYQDLIKRDLMARLTGMNPVTVSRTKMMLTKRNIIHANISIIGFNLNIDEWEKVTVSLPFKKVTVSLPKGNSRAEKKGNSIVTLQRNYKENSKKGVNVLKKLGIKEVDKLDGKPWLRATMIDLEGLPKEGTDKFLKMANFMTCYNAWLVLEDSYGVRDKIAWLIERVQRDLAPGE